MTDAREFAGAAELRAWLADNHETADGVWVALRGVAPGRPGLRYADAAREAAAVGWAEAARASLDAARYAVRFAPGAVPDEAPATGSGDHRGPERMPVLDPEYERELRENDAARDFFDRQRPAYRRAALWWVASAAHEDTRRRRMSALIETSARGERLPQVTRNL